MLNEINLTIVSRKNGTGYRFINRFFGYCLTSLLYSTIPSYNTCTADTE